MALFCLRQTSQTAALFAREIQNFPKEREAYSSLTALLWFSGRPADAQQTMEAFVRANPGSASSAFAAKAFDELGDHALAGEFRRRAQ